MNAIKSLIIVAALLLSAGSTLAQKMLWTALNGGENSNGAVVAYDLTYNQSQALVSMDGNPLATYDIALDLGLSNEVTWNSDGLIFGSDGLIYGVSELINTSSDLRAKGGIYTIDPSTGDIEVLYSFVGKGTGRPIESSFAFASYNKDLRNPVFSLIEASPGVFYGICNRGGDFDYGGIYKYETASSTYTKLYSFDNLATGGIGRYPNSPLIIGPNGDLFGVLESRGAQGAGNLDGHLYKIDISNDSVSYVSSLASSIAGWAISGAVDQICYNSSLNKIFGTKETFSGLPYGGGIYSYNFNNGVVTNETTILNSQTGILGSNANGMTPLANDGNHYFVCRNGGNSGNGTLVKYSPAANTMVKVHDFSNQPSGTGIQVAGTKIYGTYSGLGETDPIMWSYDVSTQVFNNLLTGTNDSTLGHLIQHSFAVSPTHIYGRTLWGGKSDAGSIFQYDRSTGQHSVLVSGHSTAGRGLVGEMTLLNDTIAYAFIQAGTFYDRNVFDERGGLAKINLVDKTIEFDTLLSQELHYTKARSYHYNKPYISGANKMYVTSEFRVSFGNNVNLHQLDLNASVSNKGIIHLSDAIAVNYSVLEYQPGKMIFASNDSIFVFDERTQSKTSYFSGLSDHNGLMHNNLMIASNGLVFGTTVVKEPSDATKKCVIYSIDTNTFSVSVEYVFDRPVLELNNGLTEWNGKLYGSTIAGGTNDAGYLFSHDLSTNTTSIEYSFDYTADGGVFLGEWTPYNGELYAVSYTGGSKGFGTFVKYNPASGSFTVIEHLDRSKGRAFRSTPLLWQDAFTSQEESPQLKTFSIYPNPGDGKLFIDNIDPKNSMVEVYHLSGELLMSIENQNRVDISALAKGVYLVKISEGKSTQTFKYIKLQ